MPDHRQSAPTAARLRSDIEQGRTGDKVAFPDPAASPLGTDDEAAGTPPTPERLSIAQSYSARSEPHGSVEIADWDGPVLWVAGVVAMGLLHVAARAVFAAL